MAIVVSVIGFFGRVAARLDDVMGFVSARISYAVIAFASLFVGGRGGVIDVVVRTRGFAVRHVSPNAGWPEAAAALALDIRLGGPRRYGSVFVDGAFMGAGSGDFGRGRYRAGFAFVSCELWGVVCGFCYSVDSNWMRGSAAMFLYLPEPSTRAADAPLP